jgi:hypothetical protein
LGAQYGVIKDNKLSKEGFLAISKTANDPSKKALVTEVADACANVTDDDRCEAAAKIGTCMEEEADKRGLTLN